MKYHEERDHEYGEICRMYPCDECTFSAVEMTELEKHKGNNHVESLLVDDFDMIPSSTMLETHGRIQKNLKDIDFLYDSDDEVEWQPDTTDKFSPVEKAQNKSSSKQPSTFNTEWYR